MAHIYNIVSTSDNVLIMEVHESATQPFTAPGWTDLRIGMMLSLTSSASDNTPTGFPETITGSTSYNAANFFWIGLKDAGPNLPGTTGCQFLGFSNANFGSNVNSILQTSDLGYGSSPYYWCPTNSVAQNPFIATDGTSTRILGPNTVQPHFFQAVDPANPAGTYYCGMLGFRLTRPNPTSNVITILVPQAGAHSCDIYWSNAPTLANLLARMDPWWTPVVTIGPVTFSSVPSALFTFWPFTLSRIRMSVWGVLRAA